MTDCIKTNRPFANCKRGHVEASFDGGDITSDAGGALLLRQAAQKMGLFEDLTALIEDSRRQKSVTLTLPGKSGVRIMLRAFQVGIRTETAA